MQKITNIEIKNFKSIRQAEIKDCRRINVFIGYPNVGKSNILEAIGLFSVEKELENISSMVRIEDNPSLFYNGNIDSPFQVSINSIHNIFGSYNQPDKSIVISRLFNSKEQIENRLIKSNASYKIDENKQIENFPKPSISKTIYPSEIADFKKYEFKKDTKYAYGNISNLKHPYGENIFDVISNNDLIRKEVRELFEQYNLKFAFDKGSRTFKILKDIGDDFFLISYSMIADTLQRVIFYKTAILSNKNSILLFEEPEAHMFPPYIAKFTSDIIYDRNDNQFFIATHSPFVLNDFMEDVYKEEFSIYAVGLRDGATIIKRLSDEEITEIYQYGIDLFFNLENYLKDVI